jgi:16S rRNA processing protein RimM
MSERDDMVLIGVITGAHGIKGEVRLKSFAADPAAIAGYGPLATSAGGALEIDRMRPQKDGFVATIKGVTDRTSAESLKGRELFVMRSRLPNAKADEVYVHDLVGLDVQLKDGSHLGEVAAVPNFGAGDLLEIRIEGRKETVLIPFASGFVPTVDPARGLIVVDLPEGYLDEGM